MKIVKLPVILLSMILFTSFNIKQKSDEYEIEAFYKGVTPVNGTMVLTNDDELVEAEVILSPTVIDKGKYIVNITRKSDDLYKIDGKNIYIKTRYCYEYSYSQEVVLKVEDSYSYTKGKVIF